MALLKRLSGPQMKCTMSGVSLCADICNNSLTFSLKKSGKIKYINFLEVFGIDPAKAEHRLAEIVRISEIAAEMEHSFCLVPHSVYSLSLPLFRLLREKTMDNRITSIHFMESAAEKALVEDHSGPLMDSYERSGLISFRH